MIVNVVNQAVMQISRTVDQLGHNSLATRDAVIDPILWADRAGDSISL